MFLHPATVEKKKKPCHLAPIVANTNPDLSGEVKRKAGTNAVMYTNFELQIPFTMVAKLKLHSRPNKKIKHYKAVFVLFLNVML